MKQMQEMIEQLERSKTQSLDVLTNTLATLRQEFSVAVTALEEKFSTAVTTVTTEIIKHQQRINQLETEQPIITRNHSPQEAL